MRLAADTSTVKLRGGFYTPADLARLTLDRALGAMDGQPERDAGLAVLEPSVGDGVFLRALADHPLGARVRDVRAFELDPVEAAAAGEALDRSGLSGSVRCADFVESAQTLDPVFDLLVGNPPYVRYQFLDAAMKRRTQELAVRLGLPVRGVSNLWLPLTLAALELLRPGGVFALVLPAECLTGVAARTLRTYLAERCARLGVDLMPAGAFPGVLQGVVVLSGCRSRSGEVVSGRARVRVREHDADGSVADRAHAVDPAWSGWTPLMLTPDQAAAVSAGRALASFTELGAVARFEVAVVTGANGFFTVSADTVRAHGLADHVVPLLPRLRHAPGLCFDVDDYDALAQTDAPTSLIALAAGDRISRSVRAYLDRGESEELHLRYKCAIREPWYAVPGIRAGALLLSKRVHHHPRIVINTAGVVTTDTIYRGRLTGHLGATDIAAGFHNSLTLLGAELEGRSFGGGVLELVPSEIARLRLPTASLGHALPELDTIARASAADRMPLSLVDATDQLLTREGIADPDLLTAARDGLVALQRRRHARAASV